MNIKMMAAALLAGTMAVGCSANAEKEVAGEAAVTVCGKTLTKAQIAADVEKIIAAQGDKISTNQLAFARKMYGKNLAQQFIVMNVLLAKAAAEGVTMTDEELKAKEAEFLKAMATRPDAPKTIDEAFAKFPLGAARGREDFKNGMLFEKLMKVVMAKETKKDFAAEAQKIIDRIVEENKKSEASATNTVAKIKDLKAQLDKTPADQLAAKFAELAKANSDCPSGAKGGDLGAFTHGQMVKEFDEAAFKLPVGKVSDPVKTQFGYHLIMVTKKIPAVAAKDGQPAQPEKVQASHILLKGGATQEVPSKDMIVKYLQGMEERTFMQKFVTDEIRKAKPTVSEEYAKLLPPDEKPTEAKPAEKPAEAKPVEVPAKK